MTTVLLDAPAWGHGLATVTSDGQVLDTWYPTGQLGTGTAPTGQSPALPPAEGDRPLKGLRQTSIDCAIGSLAEPPANATDAYLRLHLLSHRIIQPHQTNLDGIFGVLANVAWTSAGPCPPDRVEELRWAERAAGRRLVVYGIDKFPRMVDYVVPSGVRIGDGDRVRLGAHLAPGTTVMHEGFVSGAARTLDPAMGAGGGPRMTPERRLQPERAKGGFACGRWP